jgi:hypothetical protein
MTLSAQLHFPNLMWWQLIEEVIKHLIHPVELKVGSQER